MLLTTFTGVLVPILVVVGSGYLLCRVLDPDIRPINRISLYLLSPALIFSSLVKARIPQGETLRIVSFMLLLVGCMALLAWSSSKLFRFDSSTTTAMMLCTMFTNTGNYGLPLARFAFGESGFERAVVFFVAQAILTQTLGVYIAGAGQGGWRKGVSRLIRMPQVYAVGAALVVRWAGVGLNASSGGLANDLFRGVSLMGDAAIPLLLVILGLQLAKANIASGDRLPISLATSIRLLVSIPLSLALAHLLGMDVLSTKLAVVLGSMSTAVNVTILAVEFDARPSLVGSVVAASTALSFITLTILLTVLGAG
ncbi:MAG: AEC family transporter [Rubrobacteraceae bacterium]